MPKSTHVLACFALPQEAQATLRSLPAPLVSVSYPDDCSHAHTQKTWVCTHKSVVHTHPWERITPHLYCYELQNGIRVSIVITGVGYEKAAMSASWVATRLVPTHCINLGIALGLTDDLHFGDTIALTYLQAYLQAHLQAHLQEYDFVTSYCQDECDALSTKEPSSDRLVSQKNPDLTPKDSISQTAPQTAPQTALQTTPKIAPKIAPKIVLDIETWQALQATSAISHTYSHWSEARGLTSNSIVSMPEDAPYARQKMRQYKALVLDMEAYTFYKYFIAKHSHARLSCVKLIWDSIQKDAYVPRFSSDIKYASTRLQQVFRAYLASVEQTRNI